MSSICTQLIAYWHRQGIQPVSGTVEEISAVESKLGRKLPDDFKAFYTRVNGMVNFYPNEIDEEGFLLYPVKALRSVANEVQDCSIPNKEQLVVFAEYMHKSWWYGVELQEGDHYVIGMIPDTASFKPITTSLAEFIELYLEDSPQLYDYS